MSQDAATHLSNIAKANGIEVPSTPRDKTKVDPFSLFERVLQRPSGAELAANTERLSALAKDFRQKQKAIQRQKRKEQGMNLVIMGCPILFVAGLWYWFLCKEWT
ncbi:unnamed protein product [Fusarium venenatum]|uniref:Uncharacterized protein n=1 Tax=Fusarium venenatum TaxID=56646 RepID=A0A2L2TQI7_9HYPO|nr:uncharacterized protein FVRRES_06261 [Fusarium venenatum]KAH6993274.1 hypothetical protein EDB82DRAFT_498869 [Fusarium venenatum]CEI61825.1 unnamed protein product [Fusarium venenatum]